MLYSKIPTNYKEVCQSDLNIENKIRSNLFAWNGQFSPQFVEILLNKYSDSMDVVFDPFLGSGTTLYEAARKGISAFGVELNPSAYYMARIYQLINVRLDERKYIVDKVECLLQDIEKNDEIIFSLTKYLDNNNDKASEVLGTLVVLMDFSKNEPSLDLLNSKWLKLKETILALPYCENRISAVMGDARNVPFKDNTASLLITSPPYINVFNYHQKYRKSVELLGYDVLKIAKREFGSNRKHRSNRFLTVIQYCIDMALSINEAIRVCKAGSRMIYVVGRKSHVLGYSFCNSQLIYELATEIFNLPFGIKQERVFKNRFGQMIFEDILHFYNHKLKVTLEQDEIISSARKIAVKMIEDKIKESCENKNIVLLKEAIEKSGKIEASEV